MESAQILASGLGLVGPILLGAAAGHLALGMGASIGSLAISGAGSGPTARAQVQSLMSALVPAAAALTAGTLLAGQGWAAGVAVIVLAAAAATIGGFSRPAAEAAIRFVIFLIIAVNFAAATQYRGALLGLMAGAALWTAILALFLGALARAMRRTEGKDFQDPAIEQPAPTTAQRLKRWKMTLAHLSGWQYPIRLTFCLAVAAGLAQLWPHHHLYWIALTAAIVTRRQLEPLSVRTTQRALGTALGVIAGSVLLLYRPPAWELIVAIGLIASARPLLKARNYLAYSVIMTPLIVLIMDFGQAANGEVLLDRLLATLIGAGLVVMAAKIVCGVLPNGEVQSLDQ